MSFAFRIAVGVICLFSFTLALLFFFYAVNPWIEKAEIPFTGSRVNDSVLFGLTALLCVFVSIRLIQRRIWAWWTAFAVSVLTLVLGVVLFVSVLHPRNDFDRSEGGFGLVISLILMTPSAITVTLLSLPFVRRRFGSCEANQLAVQSGRRN